MRNASERGAGRRGRTLLLAMGLALALLLAACPLSALAVQQRWAPAPQFAFHINGVEYSGPCPLRGGMVCDEATPWYAIWRGERQPDGSVNYQQLFFVYLKTRPRPR